MSTHESTTRRWQTMSTILSDVKMWERNNKNQNFDVNYNDVHDDDDDTLNFLSLPQKYNQSLGYVNFWVGSKENRELMALEESQFICHEKEHKPHQFGKFNNMEKAYCVIESSWVLNRKS